ncbi:MAG: hypothetical protein ACRCUF_20050 [Aeromonas sobria]
MIPFVVLAPESVQVAFFLACGQARYFSGTFLGNMPQTKSERTARRAPLLQADLNKGLLNPVCLRWFLGWYPALFFFTLSALILRAG